MQLRTVLVFTLLSALAMNAEGKILKSLIKKKLALIPILAGAKHISGHKGSKNQLTSPQLAPTTTVIQSGEVIPLSETQGQSHVIDESSLVEQVHPVPASVAVYSSYAPEFRTPSVYYRAPRPVVRRTVYQYVEEPRANDNVGPLAGIPGIPSIPSIPGASSILGSSNLSGLLPGLSSLKGAFGRTLNGLSTPVQETVQAPEPANPRVTTYISYPPY